MNLLSGVTWKGAKLRLGEAKPDFRERYVSLASPSLKAFSNELYLHSLAKEREPLESGEPPRKKRRLPRGVQGVHAADMSLVTPDNVEERTGWRVTPLGRMIKPVRMRPEHPLPEPLATAVLSKSKSKKGKDVTKKKRRVKETPTRARRRTIDPLKWGSTQLKGVFLENAGALGEEPRRKVDLPRQSSATVSSDEEDSDREGGEEEGVAVEGDENESESSASSDGDSEDDGALPGMQTRPTIAKPLPASPSPTTVKAAPHVVVSELTEEKSAALGLLQSLFGNREDDDWVGRESVGSDVEMDVQDREEQELINDGGDASEVEEVSMDVDATALNQSEDEPESAAPPSEPAQEIDEIPKASRTQKLKDLFAPRQEDGASPG